ncbi:hypothetical protein A3C89_01385 [Candidatus Kaiserbacteria bacterium RIFCSPHIGHO2_02_FULL_50_50]|uniref:Uncharacterized protein n=1 Tax=Candidatus Kaiserbacteria bacterium RIFCSPHIGHO2_02_FULL_50_50 TaxID=1798492 RepID=A0A1F6DC78_9BACT|nr:MAG: hypothetical protein A3C89_01385 [Candidatus Kaiserbacteria bacterium RIFCSPHIGHO2_02_FULL_50_50]OGG89295.1 MAG: hypothetical protein A3G62_01460 [Candidatus Kaiserbacteria bacterium RIFCSPLOWO2_12_FULL_50_10]
MLVLPGFRNTAEVPQRTQNRHLKTVFYLKKYHEYIALRSIHLTVSGACRAKKIAVGKALDILADLNIMTRT